ncbi:MAG: 4-(cytidine 5'-diphospho)-2-C-methyl-D-erythritol kinase, partial [Calditrichaeota bacterium]
HNIVTIFQQIDLKDDIELKSIPSKKIEFRSNDKTLPTDEQNLCLRAVKLLWQNYPLNKGVEIFLNKNIPVGAGLGGGSSNAAVILLGLNKLWGLNLQKSELLWLASQLGSDVPFFIEGGTVLATGRGEIMEPIKLNTNFYVLLIVPSFAISTKWAYEHINLNLTNSNNFIKFLRSTGWSKFKDFANLSNDFEELIFKHYPILSEIKVRLLNGGAFYASLSGSGSAMYGLFENLDATLTARHEFQGKYRTFIAKPVKWGFEQII